MPDRRVGASRVTVGGNRRGRLATCGDCPSYVEAEVKGYGVCCSPAFKGLYRVYAGSRACWHFPTGVNGK
jgi:hypothetical protein